MVFNNQVVPVATPLHQVAPSILFMHCYIWPDHPLQYQYFSTLSNTASLDVFSSHCKDFPYKFSGLYSRFLLWHYSARQIVSHHFCNALYGNEHAPYSFILLFTPSSLCHCFHVRLTKTPAASSWQFNESPK